MIIYKCDICGKESHELETIVLYSQRIDYCENCKSKVTKMKQTMKNSIKYYNEEADRQIRIAEKNIINRRADK